MNYSSVFPAATLRTEGGSLCAVCVCYRSPLLCWLLRT